jgi:hypothetical protein
MLLRQSPKELPDLSLTFSEVARANFWPFYDFGRCRLFRRCWGLSGHQSGQPPNEDTAWVFAAAPDSPLICWSRNQAHDPVARWPRDGLSVAKPIISALKRDGIGLNHHRALDS